MIRQIIARGSFLAAGLLAGVHTGSAAVTFAVWLFGAGIVLWIDDRIEGLAKVVAEYAKLKNR